MKEPIAGKNTGAKTVPALMKRFGWKNMMAVPKLKKNHGEHRPRRRRARTRSCWDTAGGGNLGQITGPEGPSSTRAKKSIANFKIRKRDGPIGCAVDVCAATTCTNFWTACATWCFRAWRDFRGLPQKLLRRPRELHAGIERPAGVSRDRLHPRVDKIKGMNITMTTSAKNDEQGRRAAQGGLGFSRFGEKGAAQ